jgi:hypothetical protein
MPAGLEAAVGIAYSVIVPLVVIRPILFPVASVNQSAASGPLTMPTIPAFSVGIEYCIKLTDGGGDAVEFTIAVTVIMLDEGAAAAAFTVIVAW